MEFELFLIIIFILFEHSKFLIFLGIYMAATSEHFKVLNDHFEDVIKPSFRNIRVISYVLIAVVFVGGAGIWMPWAKESNITVWLPGSTVFTYSFALLGSIICNRLYFYTKSLKEIKNFYSDNLQVNEINIKFEEYEKMIMEKVESLPQDVKIRVVSTHYFDFNTDKKTESMEEINEQTSSIADAITVIDQIAFQTNILSLNAAVEAATAGEAGKGFAVVAQEVRNLASRSAEAAREIKALVENANSKADEGKQIANKMITGYSKLNENIKSSKIL